MQAELQPDLSGLSDETIVQIGVPQDDMSVGMWPRRAFISNSSLRFLTSEINCWKLQSDHYGFAIGGQATTSKPTQHTTRCRIGALPTH